MESIMNEIAVPTVNATAEFYQRSSGVKFFRAALSTTESIAPQFAARLAQRLFLTPLPPKWLQRRHAWSPSWIVEKLPFEGASLTLYRRMSARSNGLSSELETDKPHVLLIHGWGGTAAQMQALANGVADRGMVPVVIEAPGHGRSQGLSSSLPQFARALDYVAGRLTMRGASLQGVIAHSLGASAAAFALARGLPASRLVLIAPPDRPRDFTSTFAQVFGLSENTRARMQRRIEAQEAAHMDAFAVRALSPLLATPTLVVHDANDNVNSFAAASTWVDRLANGRLHATQGLGHRKILRDKSTVEAVMQFVAQLE
jgi:pimeloyl-ACP methyl ester carboxylesterase